MCVQFVNPGIFSFLMSFNVEDFTLEITVWTTVLEYSLSRFFTHADFYWIKTSSETQNF